MSILSGKQDLLISKNRKPKMLWRESAICRAWVDDKVMINRSDKFSKPNFGHINVCLEHLAHHLNQ